MTLIIYVHVGVYNEKKAEFHHSYFGHLNAIILKIS